MGKTFNTIAAGQFKAKCLALLDEVAQTGRTLVVTKRGKPVAKVVPVEEPETIDLAGSILEDDDIIGPTDESWDAEQ